MKYILGVALLVFSSMNAGEKPLAVIGSGLATRTTARAPKKMSFVESDNNQSKLTHERVADCVDGAREKLNNDFDNVRIKEVTVLLGKAENAAIALRCIQELFPNLPADNKNVRVEPVLDTQIQVLFTALGHRKVLRGATTSTASGTHGIPRARL